MKLLHVLLRALEMPENDRQLLHLHQSQPCLHRNVMKWKAATIPSAKS
jgi:hypothetical protein